MKKTLFVLIISSVGFSLHAQNFDSLYTIWQDQNQTDSARVAAYVDYVWDGYLHSQPDSAAILAEALHAFAQSRQYPRASAKGYNLQGIANRYQGNYIRALDCYQKCLAINEELGDKKGIAGCYNNIGLIYRDKGNNTRALEYYQKSLTIFELNGDKNGLAINLINIGNIYADQRNYTRALEYFERSLAIREEIDDKKGIASCLVNIAVIYADQGNKDSALENLEKSLVFWEEVGNKNGIALSLNNMSVIYVDQGNYTRGLEYHQKALAIREEIGDKSGIAISMNNIGLLYKTQGKNGLALGYCQKSLALAEEIAALDMQKDACQCLYDIYKATGKGNDALVYLEKINVIADSLNAEETARELEHMEFAKVLVQDSIAKAEEARLVREGHEEEMRSEENTRNVAIVGGVLVLLLAGGIYSRLRYTRKAKTIIEKEKDRSENLLLNILPADIAAELKEKGKADARDFDNVSILFTDFKGFTAAAEKLGAQELVREINACFEVFDGIMGKYGIEKIKTIGDAYMAAGGLPIPKDDSAKNTALAALEMQEFISNRKIELDAKGLPGFEMRVGIHTGHVVAGIVGVKKFAYDIWGDTVNTASRMESSGEVGKVNISQATYELLKDTAVFAFESRGKIVTKGKGEIEMYFISKA